MSTCADLETRARARADQANSSLVSTAEGYQYVNAAYRELYDLVVAQFQDWFITFGTAFTLTGGTQALSTQGLPANLLYLVEVEKDPNTGLRRPVPAFSRKQHPAWLVPILGTGGITPWYRMEGPDLIIEPYESAAGTYRIIYVPSEGWTNGGASGDQVNGYLERWVDYAIIRAAIMYRDKEETDPGSLWDELAVIKQNILVNAAKRKSIAGPVVVPDP